MKTVFLLASIFSASAAFAGPICSDEKVTQSYCASIDWAEEPETEGCPIEIDLVENLGAYKKGHQLKFYSTVVSFKEDGLLYKITGTYMGGTGVDVVLIDPKKCDVIEKTNVYSE